MTDDLTSPAWPMQSPSIATVAAAYVAFQAELEPAPKNAMGQVGSAKRPYTDLLGVIEASQELLAKHGLSVLQLPLACESGACVQTVLLHTSGEWIADGGLTIPAAKRDAQAVGSAQTYAKRYGRATVLGLATVDDDGAAASASPTQRSTGSANQRQRLSDEQHAQLKAALLKAGKTEAQATAQANACEPKNFDAWLARAEQLADESQSQAGAA